MGSLLLKSIQDGRIRQVGLLLKVGNNVNQQDRRGETGLMKAMTLNNSQLRMKIIKMLIRNNADVSKYDVKNRNAFMWACYYGRIEEVKYMISTCDLTLLQVDKADSDGNTAIFYAVNKGHTKLVSILVQYFNKYELQWILSKENGSGLTPLLEAFQNGYFDIAKCLLNEGKVKIDDLTNAVLQNDHFELNWSKMAPQTLIIEIINSLSQEHDPEPSNVLRLLITNESFRNVALKIRQDKGKQTEWTQRKPNLQVPKTAPSRLERRASEKPRFQTPKQHPEFLRSETEVRKSLPGQKSIKRMLPTIMNMYEEQLSHNYRPASKNEFIPYASVSRQLKNISTKLPNSTTSIRASRPTFGNLPDFSRFTRLSDPRLSRSSRSISVQLPQMNSWSLLRKKLKSNLIQDF